MASQNFNVDSPSSRDGAYLKIVKGKISACIYEFGK